MSKESNYDYIISDLTVNKNKDLIIESEKYFISPESEEKYNVKSSVMCDSDGQAIGFIHYYVSLSDSINEYNHYGRSHGIICELNNESYIEIKATINNDLISYDFDPCKLLIDILYSNFKLELMENGIDRNEYDKNINKLNKTGMYDMVASDPLRIVYDRNLIDNRLRYLNSSNSHKAFKIYTNDLCHKDDRSVKGTLYYYVSAKDLDFNKKYGLICTMIDGSCILIETSTLSSKLGYNTVKKLFILLLIDYFDFAFKNNCINMIDSDDLDYIEILPYNHGKKLEPIDNNNSSSITEEENNKEVENVLCINKDEKFIEDKIKYLTTREARDKFDLFVGNLYLPNNIDEEVIGKVYYYTTKNHINGISGMIYKLANNTCILVEIKNNLLLSVNKSPRTLLFDTIDEYFGKELKVYYAINWNVKPDEFKPYNPFEEFKPSNNN